VKHPAIRYLKILKSGALRRLLQPIEALSSTEIFLKVARSATFKNISGF